MPFKWPKKWIVSRIVNSGIRAISCGMYPTPGPGTDDPFDPGFDPKMKTEPDAGLSWFRMQRSRLVLPQPDGPKSPYLFCFVPK